MAEQEKIQGGWYLKPRCITNSKIANAPPHVREIWDWLIRKAVFQKQKQAGFKLERGQILCTVSEIQEDLHWMVGFRKERYSIDKCDYAMKTLMKEGMITRTKTTRGSIVTICNYDYYQTLANYDYGYDYGMIAGTITSITPNDRERTKTINKKKETIPTSLGAVADAPAVPEKNTNTELQRKKRISKMGISGRGTKGPKAVQGKTGKPFPEPRSSSVPPENPVFSSVQEFHTAWKKLVSREFNEFAESWSPKEFGLAKHVLAVLLREMPDPAERSAFLAALFARWEDFAGFVQDELGLESFAAYPEIGFLAAKCPAGKRISMAVQFIRENPSVPQRTCVQSKGLSEEMRKNIQRNREKFATTGKKSK